ncbi:MAG: phosphoglycerate dehydrogenase [Phycisphaera sp.]|nr:phosphoglycerate dehydrogenase [Phycisphaera sp.]
MTTTTTAPNATAVNTLRILVAGDIAPAGIEYLESQSDIKVDVVPVPELKQEDKLIELLREHDGFLLRSNPKVTAKVLANPGRLKAIARAGVGVDNIDLDAATNAGVLVMNSAEASTITTAEHAFTLMMALARNVGPAYKTMSNGGWDRNKFVGRELYGKTLGLVGFGRIGRTVAERALAFGMTVLAFDPVFNADTALDGKVRLVKSFDDLVPECDFVSFHVPLNEHTRNMLNAERFAKAKDGMMVINAARGGVIDIPALIEALDSGKCGGAAIDVYETEPPAEDDPLRTHPKVLCTPHLGASTTEAQEGVSTAACLQIVEYLRGENIRGAVNAPGVRLDLDPAQLKFVDLARRMGRLIAPMCEAGISDVTITCNGDLLTGASDTIERMTLVELLSARLDTPVNVVNANLLAEARGITIRTVNEDKARTTPRVTIELTSGDTKRRIVGSVFNDGMPRILEINGYHMDMVPVGPIAILLNEDKPGMIGMVGTEFGSANANIADMALSRKGDTAMMVLKLDVEPDASLLNRLSARPGILKIVVVKMPTLD